jgi:RNA polymerase sigma-70 factor, ECF subfamily
MSTREGLVMAAQAGDREAFRSLVEAEGPAALRLATAILHSAPDGEDAVQDAFLRVWLDLPDLRAADRWPAWFRRLVVHAALDRARRPHRVREVALIDHEAPDAGETGADLGERDRVRRALVRLRPEERALLVLRFAEDLDVQGVADALKIPVGTAKSRLHRVLARMGAALEAAS